MAKENSKDPAITQPQQVPLAKIHDLPGVIITKQPDKSYGGLVTSIQAGGVKEPVVLRLREDGEYQLVTGYRRRKASELAKKQDIPALVYEMSLQEAQDYHHRVKKQPDMAIPGKLIQPPAKEQDADLKKPENPTAAPAADGKGKDQEKPAEGVKAPAAGGKGKEQEKPAEDVKAPAADGKGKEQEKPAEGVKAPTADGKGKDQEKPAEGVKAPAADGKGKNQEKPTEGVKAPAADGKGKNQEKPAEGIKAPAADGKGKDQEKPTEGIKTPAADSKGKEQEKPTEGVKAPAADGKGKEQEKPTEGVKPPVADGKGKDQGKPAEGVKAHAADDKAKGQEKPAEGAESPTVPAAGMEQTTLSMPTEKGPALAADDKDKGHEAPAKNANAPVQAATGPAAKGPAGTTISQVLPERLSPPDEAAKKDFPAPREGESIFVTLHPAYLENSEYNIISVDTKSEDYQELKKSIELNGVKDPVLARIGEKGTLEIVSGQRRHMIATELNYPVPTIIQKISTPDVKILVADGNLHRPKISTYDLARSLRMKMEGMKQKAGRRKKGTFKAEELDSDVKLAQEMGMPVSKLNRLIRLSEATKDLCDRVDDNSVSLSLAHSISFLKPENQDEVLHLMDLGSKIPVERIEYMKKVEKAGKLNAETMRDVIDGKNVLDPPKQEAPEAPQPEPSAPAASTIPPSPDVAPPAAPPSTEGQESHDPTIPAAPSAPAPASTGEQPSEGQEPFDGKQERPEYTKVILAGDRLRKYFPDVMMTPREIEESIYEALEERRQRQEKQKEKLTIFPKKGPSR